MQNLALESTGAQVVQGSSWDPRHPPEAVIDGLDVTFWSTTGMFPQELVISFDSVVQISEIETRSFNIKGIKLLRSVAQFPTDFNEICASVVPDGEGQKQIFQHKVSATAVRHLKITLTSGYDDFTGIYSIVARGENLDINPFK